MYVASPADQWVYRQFCAAQAVAKCQLGISALGERIDFCKAPALDVL
jgi:hypothetical protein